MTSPPEPLVQIQNNFTDLFDETVGPDALGVVRPTRVYRLNVFCSGIKCYLLMGPYICFISFLYLDFYVLEMMH